MHKHNYKEHYVIFKYYERGVCDLYHFRVHARNEKHALVIFGFQMGYDQSLDIDCLTEVVDVVDHYDITSENWNFVQAWGNGYRRD